MNAYDRNPEGSKKWPSENMAGTECLYHCLLVDTLALISKGKNTACEAKCQVRLIPPCFLVLFWYRVVVR